MESTDRLSEIVPLYEDEEIIILSYQDLPLLSDVTPLIRPENKNHLAYFDFRDKKAYGSRPEDLQKTISTIQTINAS